MPGLFPDGAAFGTGSPAETAQQPSGLGGLLSALYNSFGETAKRAIGNSQTAMETGYYNPAPVMEAALLPMGTGAVAGVPVKGAEAVIGAGPIRAYHGSPHNFDRFDLSKIGTGEGAQAYGHGLYFAEKEGVAKGYRDVLARDGFLTGNGQIFDPSSLQHLNVRAALTRTGGDLDAAINKARELIPTAPPQTLDLARSDLARLEALKAEGGLRKNPGHMYEVGIKADPAHFLDWDKPIAQQSEAARNAARQLGMIRPEYTGSEVYKTAAMNKGADRASGIFNEAGVPGIKYLDQGSRGAGEGSRNYVVFNDKLIDIMRKYGIAGLAAPPAVFSGAVGNDGK